ncbi:DUF3857 domain-containing protein [Chitinophaga horti]|uniref:DUF3857 domain-containing protein n=1 Tax=Chitinophaga horti TaxID=2920382 RepID=A0ABY6J4W4_9BACT|nr:DUF3857 domain-containing protein [Chitinophaga horti]UYQ94715.1 DUF3857 domain-containing protein [Chitinophaga horti]
MTRYLYSTLLLLLTVPALAADPDYNAALIPKALKENADVVKRMERITVKLDGLKDVVIVRTYALTIMNENGDDYANVFESYGQLGDVRGIHGALYDANGKQLRKLKSSEIKDLSGSDNSSLMTDTRYKHHNFYHRVYPYTIVYEIETKEKQTFFLPDWFPQSAPSYAVQQSLFEISVPEDYQLRWRAFGYPAQPLQKTEKGKKTYTWEVKDMPALESEPFSKEWHNRTTAVYLGPGEFQMDAYKGQMATWQDLGKFVYELNKGRDVLPDNIKAKVHELTDALADPKQKIASLYRYLQQNTRYISIQLGIGGWQTFDAAYVAGKGYGDCKALSNYMCALLKEAGIRSHYTLVKAGRGETEMIEDFPISQFNHIIVSVPLSQDTVWLECTSQTLPPGYLSGFTANRAVLLVDESGGKLVRTPKYGMEQNLRRSRLTATITDNGDAQMEVRTHATGQLQDDLHATIHSLSREKQLEELRDNINLPSYEIKNFGYKEFPGELPAIDEELNISAAAYASVTGKRMFITPNILSRSGVRIQEDTARRSEIFLPFSSRSVDTVLITIPEGYTPETSFQPVTVSNKFGKYTCSATVTGNRITYVRARETYDGVFPPSDLKTLRSFYEEMYKADRQRIVFVKQ